MDKSTTTTTTTSATEEETTTTIIMEPDFQGAKQLVYSQLEQLDKNLFYHGRHHTFDDVLPNAILLSREAQLTPEDTLIVITAALFHDTGFLDQYDKNEPMGCERARKYLPSYGYTESQIDHICQCIMATQMPQNPKQDVLAQLVCDADLGHLGTDLYFLRAESLRIELIRMNKLDPNVVTAAEWNRRNLPFLQNHSYFSDAAKRIFQAKKEQNEKELKELLKGDNTTQQ